MKKLHSKKQRALENFFIYTLIALAFSIICSSPFWLPSLCSSMKKFLFVSVPKIGFLLLNPKVFFILGNLIVVVLIGESKFFASKSSSASDIYYDEYVSRSQSLQKSSVEKRERIKMEKCIEENVKKTCEDGENIVLKRFVKEKVEYLEKQERDHEVIFPAEELSKRADDFIARVNRQRRLEATLLCCAG